MTRRAPNIVEVVENAFIATEEEVDEITEVTDSVGQMVPAGLDPSKLDDFLREQFDTTATGEENGMPSLLWLRKHFQTKSASIRYLHHRGHSVKDVAKHLGLRYQHVRNVLTVELKRGPNENWAVAADEESRISPGLLKIDQKF